MDLNEKLSANFTLGEFLRSATAERNAAWKRNQENPPRHIVDNLRYLCQTVLQPLRESFGVGIRINSGYRGPAVNKAVGGSPRSQHCHGQAADCAIGPAFLTSHATEAIRRRIEQGVLEVTGRPIRDDVNPNFYLFAYICLNLDKFDIDQVIHEYGGGPGQPGWVHVAASRAKDKRQILVIGKYVPKIFGVRGRTKVIGAGDLKTALSLGVDASGRARTPGAASARPAASRSRDHLAEALSPNFTLGEFLRSATAERNAAWKRDQENPPERIVENLRYLARTVLQPIRETFGIPMRITSGYRGPAVNKAVGGSPRSQHCHGQAADCGLAPDFLTSSATEAVRRDIERQVMDITGKPIRSNVNANYYLFAFICLNLDRFDVDQVIHEYGGGPGQPGWVHVSASRDRDMRQILVIGKYVPRIYGTRGKTKRFGADELKRALALGT